MKTLLLFLTISFSVCAVARSEPVRRFEDLGPENQKLVKSTYQDLLVAYEKKDFPRMKGDTEVILALLVDYIDARAYAAIAERGLRKAARGN